MKPDLLDALREAVEAVRDQIPAGQLTVGSVERLLRAADAVLTDASVPRRRAAAGSLAASKRAQAREKWARIARQNATEPQDPSSPRE
jgi:hypothetical protein